jgi:acetyl-CoA carboxylase alpha subunit
MAANLKGVLIRQLADLADQDLDEVLARRYKRLMGYARFKE